MFLQTNKLKEDSERETKHKTDIYIYNELVYIFFNPMINCFELDWTRRNIILGTSKKKIVENICMYIEREVFDHFLVRYITAE